MGLIDLRSRLANARTTEQRLLIVLRDRAGKLPEVLQAEKELDRLRQEIEGMQARARQIESHRRYAILQLQINEQYRAPASLPPPSTWTRVRNAAVEGYLELSTAGLWLLTVALSMGPVFLFWVAILFWPVRFAWRQWRARKLAEQATYSF